MAIYVLLFGSNADIEAGKEPNKEHFAKLAAYQEKIATEGKLIWAERFVPTSVEAVRVSSDGTVTKGPFEGPTAGGYAIVNVADIDEAISLVNGFGDSDQRATVEIRKVVNVDELPVPDEVKAHAKKLRELQAKNATALHG